MQLTPRRSKLVFARSTHGCEATDRCRFVESHGWNDVICSLFVSENLPLVLSLSYCFPILFHPSSYFFPRCFFYFYYFDDFQQVRHGAIHCILYIDR